MVDVKAGVCVYVGGSVSVGVGVAVGTDVLVGVSEEVIVGVIIAVGAGEGLSAQIKPPPKPIANKSNPKGIRRINQRRMILILGANYIPRKRCHSKMRRYRCSRMNSRQLSDIGPLPVFPTAQNVQHEEEAGFV